MKPFAALAQSLATARGDIDATSTRHCGALLRVVEGWQPSQRRVTCEVKKGDCQVPHILAMSHSLDHPPARELDSTRHGGMRTGVPSCWFRTT